MSRIVVAEDDPHILRVICLWLSRQGHEVMSAQNGLEALSLISAHQPAIVVTDVNMPGMDGLELLVQIENLVHRPAGVVVLTNRWDHREIGDRLAAGQLHVLPKPFSPSKLAALIEELTAAPAAGDAQKLT